MLEKKETISNKNLSTETHVGVLHPEMLVDSFVVDTNFLNL